MSTGCGYIFDHATISGLDVGATPERVRITIRTERGGVRAGDWGRLRAVLPPPPGPAAPGAFDFARRAWFERLGAVGYAISPATRIDGTAESNGWFAPGLGRLRNTLAARVRDALGPAAGGVAAALMTGDRGTIPAADLAAMRDEGLAHLLAISGLHMGLLAASLFFVVRASFALWPAVTLRYPIKKWAAAVTLIGAFGYLLVTGATVPTQRAYLMTGLVLVAVMLDRLAFSMALVAWAATVVLMARPESLLGPSFQISFAAVVALIAVYEALRERLTAWRRRARVTRRLGLYLLGVGITTLIAGLATAPFAAFHFDRVVSYGLIANLGAVPITALWIMPLALAAYALMPFGLEGAALVPMGWGIEAVLWIAHTVAAWPAAVTPLPPARSSRHRRWPCGYSLRGSTGLAGLGQCHTRRGPSRGRRPDALVASRARHRRRDLATLPRTALRDILAPGRACSRATPLRWPRLHLPGAGPNGGDCHRCPGARRRLRRDRCCGEPGARPGGLRQTDSRDRSLRHLAERRPCDLARRGRRDYHRVSSDASWPPALGPRPVAYLAASVAPQQPNQAALHSDLVGAEDSSLVSRVGGF